ncbi:MAG: sugar transporter permease [Frondihabitans sp.]|nr:sugar transporter permease [Frondihabitans sp.]
MAFAVLPAVILIVGFLGVPAIQGIRIAFSDWRGFGPVDFIGFGNFVNAIKNTPFLGSLGITAIYSLSSMVGIVVVATLLAVAVSSRMKGSPFYRVVWFLPGIAPVAAVGVFWSVAFQPHTGIINVFLGAIGLGSNHAWLASENLSIYPTIFVTIWANVGFAFLLLLGAVEQIPISTYEAAKIDGSSAVRTFFSITLPLIRPVLAVTAILELIFQFNGFTIIFAMTQGGPGYATSVLPVLVYKEAFQQVNFGLASAMAVMGGAILIVVGLVSIRLSRSKQEENI